MDKTTVTDGESDPETLAAMQRSLEDHAETPSKARRWLPVVFVSIVILAILVGLSLGIKALVGGRDAAPAPEPTLEILEGAPHVEAEAPVELDEYGNPLPQRVPVDVGLYPAAPGECSTLDLPRSNPFCDNVSDRALTDRNFAHYMAALAADSIAPDSPGSVTFTLDRVHWLRQVAASPIEDGGPQVEHREQYLEILDRWLADDYSQAHEEWAWLRSILD